MKRAIAAIALTIAVAGCYGLLVWHKSFAMDDFKTFYCAGRTVLARENPYDAAPIGACERIRAPAPLFVAKSGFVLPAPLPGYAIAAFAAIGWMPFGIAVALWILLTVAATAVAVVLLRRLGAGDAWTILVACSIPLVAVSWLVGELPPFALLGIVLAAWGAREDNLLALCTGVALAMLEPQAGIAVALAAFALSRRFAVGTVLTLAALGAMSLAAVGIAGNVAYARDVLPAHVASELPAFFQYSFSWMLDRIGVAAPYALLAGRLQWIAMLCLTVLFARSAYARLHPECAMLAAPAFAVVGGPFLHLDHIALALPAALWLASRRGSWIDVAAVVTLAVPLLHVLLARETLVFVPFIALWLGWSYGRSLASGLVCALAAVGGVALGVEAFLQAGFGFTQVAASVHSTAISQAPWAQFVASHYVMSSWAIWAVKAPVWFGLVATAAGMVTFAGARLRTQSSRTGRLVRPTLQRDPSW